MENEKLYISRFTKVLSEKVGEYYWFDIGKYVRLAKDYDFKPSRLYDAIECIETDTLQIPTAKTIGRVLGFYNGEKEGKGSKSVSMHTAKELGKALCDGDEYGLLIKIEPANVRMIIGQSEEIFGTGDINYIYKLMNDLLYEMQVSYYYSYRPDTEEDGFEYYDMKLQHIRNEIDSRFWNKKATRDKLYHLVEEEEEFIKSYNRPGTPGRWMEANPRLRYYDCVFDFMEECPEIYQAIKNCEITTALGQIISFNFYPTEQECLERKLYFEELEEKNRKQNRRYTEDRFYQNEIIEAFRMVFEKDFA